MRLTEKEFAEMFPALSSNPALSPKAKRKPSPAVIPTEHQEQVKLVRHVHEHYADDMSFVDEVFFAIPNGMLAGGHNKFALMKKFQTEGLKNGVSDILYLQARGIYGGLAIEMKRSDLRTRKDGGMRVAQTAFQEAARKIHWAAVTCYTGEEAITVFDNYMSLTPLVAVRIMMNVVNDDEVDDEMPSLA